MSPFEILSEDHERLLDLCNRLTGAKGWPAGSPKERHRVAERLVMEGSAHEAVEEQFLWPVVRDRLEGGPSLATGAVRQEMGARSMLHELNRMRPGNVRFESLVFALASHVRAHLTYEESQIWPKLELALDPEELDRIGSQMQRARPLAPTRPHPHTPPESVVSRTAGPLTAMVDRTLDLLTSRGK